MLFFLDLAGNRNVPDFHFVLWRSGPPDGARDVLERLPLLYTRVLGDVDVGEVPVAERFHHRLSRRALPDKSDSQVIEAHVPIVAFSYEPRLPPATSPLR